MSVLTIKVREGLLGDHKNMRRKRRRRSQKRAKRGRGFFQKAMAYNAQPLRLLGVGGYLGTKLALKVLGPKAQKQFAPFMSKLKKVTFI